MGMGRRLGFHSVSSEQLLHVLIPSVTKKEWGVRKRRYCTSHSWTPLDDSEEVVGVRKGGICNCPVPTTDKETLNSIDEEN